MRIAKKTILIITLFLVVVGLADAAKTGQMTAKEKRTKAMELLDKYAETQNRLKSFTAKVMLSCNRFSSGLMAGRPWKSRYWNQYDICSDGKRVSIRNHRWGKLNQSLCYKKDDNHCEKILWDGEKRIRYCKKVAIQTDIKDPNRVIRQHGGQFFMGHFYGFDERIDVFLQDAEKLSVRDTTDNVEGSRCYVVEGVKKGGVYRLWIDPKHGYNIAKISVKATTGKPGLKEYFYTFKNVRFRKIQGIWVPIKGDLQNRFNYQSGHYCGAKYNIKTTEMILNPDFDAMGAFVPDFPNGAKTHIIGHKNKRGGIMWYTWQDGKVVDANGKVVMDCLKKRKGDKK